MGAIHPKTLNRMAKSTKVLSLVFRHPVHSVTFPCPLMCRIISVPLYKHITQHLEGKDHVFTNCCEYGGRKTTSLECRDQRHLSTEPHRFTKSLLVLYNNYALGKDKIIYN